MSADDNGEAESDAPAVELGEGEPVAGAPIARVASRLTWPQEKSEIERKEGAVEIRTPEGPRPLSGLLEAVDDTYFARRQDFVAAVRDAAGHGPVRPE